MESENMYHMFRLKLEQFNKHGDIAVTESIIVKIIYYENSYHLLSTD